MAVKCNACPNLVFERIEDYRAHQKTKWHAFNTEQRLMGRCTLTEEQYLEKVGGGGGAAAGGKAASPAAKPEQAATAAPASPPGMATVVVIFEHNGERWSHQFLVAKGATVLDLQRSMVRKESPPEDLLSFNLKKGMIRAPYFETVDGDETFQFNYCGYEEGQKLFDKDKARKDREEGELQQRREEEQRQKEERLRREEERKRREEEEEAEEKRREEERKRKQEEEEEEEKKKLEEERRLAQEAEEKKKLEEDRRRAQEEEEKKKLEEERRRAEEEKRKLEEDRRRAQEEEEKKKLEEEEQRRAAELASQRQRAEQEEGVERKRQADVEASRSGAAEEEVSKPPSGDAAEVEIVVYIERSLDIKTVMRLRLGDSVWAVKERLARDDPTNEASASDFGLIEPIFGQELADTDKITAGLTELDVYVRT